MDRIGGLIIEELAVTSGFSRVWRAWDPLLARPAALKVFHLDPGKEARLPYPREVWRRRFIAEARLLAGIDSPHVVRVDALGALADGTPFVRMPWYPANLRREIGQDATDPDEITGLTPLQQPRAVSPRRAAQILRQLCLGLAALHKRGIVHRDVKPTNLLLTERENGAVKLCDLGLAKTPEEWDRHLPRDGVWIGTPDYAAPEQMADASRVDDRADVYAAGVLGYRLVTGRLPAPGASLRQQGGAPAALGTIVDAAMEPVAARRPTALQMAAACETAFAAAETC